MITSMRTHPLLVAAATAVILTCLLAIGIMTGIIPSPLARDRGVMEERAEVRKPPASTESRLTAKAPAPPRERKVEAPAGSTRSTAPSGSVAGSVAGSAPAVCNNCGTVTSVRAVKQQGDAGLIGPIAGGAIGGAVGSQIGGGSGKTIATIIGAAGGAAVGTEVERRSKSTTSYVVGVRLNNGTTRDFTYQSAPGVSEGDRIRVVDERLIRDS